jgi:hypothetical protein
MFENGLLKVATAKVLGIACPLGIVALVTALGWTRHKRRPAALLRAERRATRKNRGRGTRRPNTDGSPQASARAGSPVGAGNRYATSSASVRAGVVDRQALLSQIIEENVRLRERLR